MSWLSAPFFLHEKSQHRERHPVQAWHYILCSYVLDVSYDTVSWLARQGTKQKARPKNRACFLAVSLILEQGT
ncbi:hypothetical protein HMPREF0239_01007 [Clostridium sp. ATCC BAA-442]|uniref:Uncharacterized protein n=1 Tax=Flavonifractor plautii ATCC 29863 TaxID=411475 RepID=G9YUK6_FLAPL|nr:hypothetical protein HMPREF0372_03221 [Flavonifractor plautii ATCC 29863]ERI78939.1 hypothetical protein HMPREF0239_01007 [Clostridium sp. ATCC BAA-442]